MKKLPLLTAVGLAVSTSAAFAAGGAHGTATVADITDGSPYYYTAAADADVTAGVGGKATTDSGINHLPVYHGNMMTNNTYRFVNVAEQVLTMIGDGKHGLWRVQDNGTVREYITQAADAVGSGLGCAAPCDINDPENLATLMSDYTHFDEPASFGTANEGGYKSETGFNGIPVNDNGAAGYVDLPIFHPKYAGKYDSHAPIDLPHYYCTMSANNYAKSRAAMDFAFSQPAAGKVGPLGVRAGLDVSENYTRVLQLESLPDASIWANVRNEDEVLWRQVDQKRTQAEIYIVERPFFNEDYLFITVVFNDKHRKSEHSYIRPDGAYYDHLKARKAAGEKIWFSKRLRHEPRIAVNREYKGRQYRAGRYRIDGTRLYGVHHPGGLTIGNGACPSMGGDFGDSYYGASWPTTYQEVTPLCDAIVIDIKLYANLDGKDWDTEAKNLANVAGSVGLDPSNSLRKEYTNVIGTYGAYTDPYLLGKGISNPDEFDATGTDELFYNHHTDQVEVNE